MRTDVAAHAARASLALATGLAALSACRSGAPPWGSPDRAPECVYVQAGPGPPGAVPIRVETVVTGLVVPWGLAFLPDGTLLVTERPGRIRRVRHGRLAATPVARIPAEVVGEGGLMGIALHPDFATNRLFFVYYTARREGDAVNRVERYRLADDGASATSERVILDGIPASQNHDGGRLRVGPDGMLYVGTGDARDPDLAQDARSLAG
jgi:glucose/arabinose dehydrogenase